MSKKSDKEVMTSKNSSSREAVENAIRISKGPRSTTWEDIAKKGWDKSQGWDESDEAAEKTTKRRVA